MTDLDTFGHLFVARSLEEGVQTVLTNRLDMYLAAVERVLDVDAGYFPHVDQGSIQITSEFDSKPGDNFPYIDIVAPGTTGDPQALGDGRYKASWGFGVVASIKSTDAANARKTAESYAAAIRSCLLQNKSLGGLADGLRWRGEAYDETPVNTSRTIGVAMLRFEADVIGIVDALSQPNRENDVVDHPDHHTAPDDYETVEDGKATLTIDTF